MTQRHLSTINVAPVVDYLQQQLQKTWLDEHIHTTRMPPHVRAELLHEDERIMKKFVYLQSVLDKIPYLIHYWLIALDSFIKYNRDTTVWTVMAFSEDFLVHSFENILG